MCVHVRACVRACVCTGLSAGGREGDSVFKWEASFVQEASGALGARTGEGKCQTLKALDI